MTAEQKVFIRAAEILKMFGLPANENTIKFHYEWSATECPWRTIQVHGRGDHWNGDVKLRAREWVIREIASIMQGNQPTPIEETMHTLNGCPSYEEATAKRKQMES